MLAGLTACGPLYENNAAAQIVGGVFDRSLGSVGIGDSTVQVDSAATEQPTALTRETIEGFDTPLLRISVISREATGIVFWAGENGSKVTWVTEDALSFTFDDGLAVATRGLGDDLMGSDVSAAKRSFSAGGSHLRTLDFLNSLAQIERQTYQCQTVQTGRETITIFERSYATTVFDETCIGENGDFKNTYWRDANGVIWQSRQWISAGVGYIGYQRL